MVDSLSQPEVESGVGHTCRFGARIPEPAYAGGGGHLVRKPTRWASSSPEVLKRARLRCSNEGLPRGSAAP
eukprot:15469453-Alexandrium_andersonii.AAC.1